MSNAFELSELASVVQQDRTAGVTTFNEVGALGVPSGTTAQRPTPVTEGYVRYNTTFETYEGYQNGRWVILRGETDIQPAQVSASPAFASGAGTLASPYIVTASSGAPGVGGLITTVTVTGLFPYEVVDLIDLSAVANGNRFRFSNTMANASGVLVFDVNFVDSPSSGATSYTLNLKIGGASVYVRHVRTIAVPGVTWVQRTSGVATNLEDIAYGNSKYVVVGSAGVILTSPDAITWTPQTSGVATDLRSITWSGTQFVTVGSAGVILTSPDAITWTPQTSGATTIFYDVTWNGSLFVAVGQDGMIRTSPDGITWTARTSNVIFTLFSVTWSGSLFVAVGGGSRASTSPDGITWTSRTMGGSQTFNGVTWTGTQFAAVGNGGNIRTSPDGITWTSRTSGITNTLQDVTWNGSLLVNCGSAGVVQTSPDGITWTSRVSTTVNVLQGVSALNGIIVAVGGNGTILTSGL